MLLSYQWILGWYGIVLEFIWQICNLILITYLVLAIYLLSTYIWISIYILVNLKFNYFCKDFTFLQCFLELQSEETRPGFIQILCLFSNNVFPLIFLYPQTSKIASPNTHYISNTFHKNVNRLRFPYCCRFDITLLHIQGDLKWN